MSNFLLVIPEGWTRISQEMIDQIGANQINDWVKMADYGKKPINLPMDTALAHDADEHPVLLFQNPWSIKTAEERNTGIVLEEIRFTIKEEDKP